MPTILEAKPHTLTAAELNSMRWRVQDYGIVDIHNSIWLRRISGPDLTKMSIGEGAFCHFMTGADANMAHVMRVS